MFRTWVGAAAATSRYLPATLLCDSCPAPHEAAERGCSEAVSERRSTICIVELGIEFSLQVRGTTPPLLRESNAYELSIVGLHWGFLLILVRSYMYQQSLRTGSASSVTIYLIILGCRRIQRNLILETAEAHPTQQQEARKQRTTQQPHQHVVHFPVRRQKTTAAAAAQRSSITGSPSVCPRPIRERGARGGSFPSGEPPYPPHRSSKFSDYQ